MFTCCRDLDEKRTCVLKKKERKKRFLQAKVGEKEPSSSLAPGALFVLLFFTIHPEYGVWLWLQVWVDPDWSDRAVELGQ